MLLLQVLDTFTPIFFFIMQTIHKFCQKKLIIQLLSFSPLTLLKKSALLKLSAMLKFSFEVGNLIMTTEREYHITFHCVTIMIVNHNIPTELKCFCVQSHSQHHASCALCSTVQNLQVIGFYIATQFYSCAVLLYIFCIHLNDSITLCGITLQIKATLKEGEKEYIVFKTNITQNYSFKVNSKRNIP